MARQTTDTRTLDLLAWEPPAVRVGYEPHETRGGSLDAAISRAVSLALHRCGKRRDAVANDMARELGRPVSIAMLDSWASQARSQNRIPLDAFAALVASTGQHELLGLLPQMFGFVVVPERYAEIIELHLIEEKRQELDRRAAALTARVRGR